MPSLCHACSNIVFVPVTEGDELEFRAVLHPNLAALGRSAEVSGCPVCTALLGIVCHRPWGLDTDPLLETWPDVGLRLQYPLSEWEFTDLGDDEIDYPTTVFFTHPLGSDFLKLAHPEILSRSRWTQGPGRQLSDDLVGSARADTAASDPGPPQPDTGAAADDSTGSDAAMRLAARWIDTCRKGHKSCQSTRGSHTNFLPTRLLDLSHAMEPGGVVVVVGTSTLGGAAEYATLSHRWTPENPCTLTTSNENELSRKGIHLSKLSRTFAEARVTTRKLGISYLWIDSLCILQDSAADKANEIPLMADYYENAVLNIAASAESVGGLWRARDGRATKPFKLPATFQAPGPASYTEKLVLDLAPVLRAPPSHLDGRGWILQERIFPLRTLFFDSYWISFDCAEMAASESCPGGLIKPPVSPKSLGDALGSNLGRDYSLSAAGELASAGTAGGRTLSQADRNGAYTLWQRVVEDYSRRSLTFESDRLPAIAALATRMARLLDDTYVAGLWRSRILDGLEWDCAGKWRERRRASVRRAPSWSWACLEHRLVDGAPPGPADAHETGLPYGVGYDDIVDDVIDEVEVLSIEGVASGSSSTTTLVGSPDAKLVVRGRPLRSRVYRSDNVPLLVGGATHNEPLESVPAGARVTAVDELVPPKDENRTDKLYWRIHAAGRDASGVRGMITMTVTVDDYEQMDKCGGVAWVLPLRQKRITGFWMLFSLVLREVSDGVFERVGVVRGKQDTMLRAQEKTVVLV
ncbi:hypothetical protein MAPG_03450 [Magnaporthiopsis poae ATCC 64411]|uniref:Heterokaryon incompatibility domain-containing protein n=1 Tax=Magnaporthiopsis poae (strain ATCC 64411 / 73-15) TaxID=644358 RepID=A0A0C4DU16_MAGP6|nr:hypothetical protein MAPG_03450 [Magnaporthiopsis poae ATCC 64411]